MKFVKSNVCMIGNLTCMGCCGRDYDSKEEVTEGISKNTGEFKEIKDKKQFLKRKCAEFLRECGVCRQVIFADKDKTKVMCPIHPAFNKSKDEEDLRKGHCDISYLCKTAFVFSEWKLEKQNQFIDFILSKKLDWYDYSMGMDNDTLLEEFEKN